VCIYLLFFFFFLVVTYTKCNDARFNLPKGVGSSGEGLGLEDLPPSRSKV
jgi:hypothetical protein